MGARRQFEPGIDQELRGHLAPQEKRIIDLVTQGKRNKDIAAELGITIGTAKSYVSRVFLKTGAHSRTELAIMHVKGLI